MFVVAVLLRIWASAAFQGATKPQVRRPTALNLMPIVGESMVALVTPMDHNGDMDLGALRSLLEWHVECGTKAVVVLGTTGEASTLSKEERDNVLAETAKVVQGKLAIVVGTGTIDTMATIEMTKRAADSGADASLIVTPYYVKPTQHGMVRHFTTVAEAVDLPMLLYNVPGRTGVDLKPETVGELAAHPRIVGIKEATGDNSRVSTLRELCGEDFVLVSGEDSQSLDFVHAGGDGVISVTANVAPSKMQQMMTLAKTDHAQAKLIDDTLAPLHDKLFCEANPIPVKWALSRAGRIPPGIRLPLTELSPNFHADIEEAMTAAGVDFVAQ